MNDYYATLGVERNASPDQIKRAYRRMSVKLHPDVAEDGGTGPDAEERMKEVNQAYQVLSDPEKRQQYDLGVDPFAPAGSAGAGYSPFSGAGGFGDVFEAMFNMAAGNARQSGPVSRRQRGRDLVESVTIELAEATFGTSRDLTIQTYTTCEACHGSCCAPGTSPERCSTCAGQGQVTRVVRSLLGSMRTAAPCPACQGFGSTIAHPCPDCSGTGRVRSRQTIPVDLPAGVGTGTRIRVSGQGEAGPGGGPAGDLYLDVRVKRHPDFVRDGNDLHCTLEVPMTAAALGATLTVASLDGEQEIDVAPGTQHGEVVTLYGLGTGRLSGTGRGDLCVHLDVRIPAADDETQRDLLRQLASLRGEERPEGRMAASGGGVFSRLRDKLQGK